MEDNPQSDLVALVIEQFQKLKRGPYGTEEALKVAREADSNSTERIILDESESAWRAFFAANKAAEQKHGFYGKVELLRLLNELKTKNIADQRAFAKQLAHRMESGAGSSSRDIAKSSWAKRRRTASEDSTPASLTTVNGTSGHHVSPESAPEQVRGKDGATYVGASLLAAKKLFHDDFWESIRRIPSKRLPGTLEAGISMVFQQGHIREHFGCQMEIEITQEKVVGYALELFNVKVEDIHGVRSVRYPGGGKIEPDPSIKLRGCRRDMGHIFEDEMFQAICASPIYQREGTEGRNRTDGISMTISNQAKEGAKITVFLGDWKAVNISRKLYI